MRGAFLVNFLLTFLIYIRKKYCTKEGNILTFLLEAYSPVGDILTVVLCAMCWIFLSTTYAERQKNLLLIYVTSFIMAFVAVGYITLHVCLASDITNLWLLGLENAVYIAMIAVFMCFAFYLGNLFNLTQSQKKPILYMGVFPLIVYSGLKIAQSISMYPNYHSSPKWGFLICYMYYCICLIIMILHYRNKIAPKMIRCLVHSFILSLLLTIGQSLIPTFSFLTISFMFPILAALFLFHYNPYDAYTGALDKKALASYLKDRKKKEFGIYCLRLQDFCFDKNPLSLLFLQNVASIFKDYQVFRIYEDTLFLVFNKKANLNLKILNNLIPHRVSMLYKEFHIPFKLTYTDCDDITIDYVIIHDEMQTKTRWNSFSNKF